MLLQRRCVSAIAGNACSERQQGVRGEKRPKGYVERQVDFVVSFDREPLQMQEAGQHGVLEKRPELGHLADVQQRVGFRDVFRNVFLAFQLRLVMIVVFPLVHLWRTQEVVRANYLVVGVFRRLPVGLHASVEMRLQNFRAYIGQRRITQHVSFPHVRALVQQR